METKAKIGRPSKDVMELGTLSVELPAKAPGVFMLRSFGQVLKVCVSSNMKQAARHMLHYQNKVVRAAIDSGDLMIEVALKQELEDMVALRLKATELKALYGV